MPDTPYYVAINRKIRLSFIILTIIFFLILVGFAIVAIANQRRVDDIQDARVESCERTYAGVGEVLKPFFPPEPRTDVQQARLDLFLNKIKELQAECPKQTGQEGG